jgi:Na+/H+ antiporter NhaA
MTVSAPGVNDPFTAIPCTRPDQLAWAGTHGQMLGVPLGFSPGDQMLRLELRHRINDGLMAIFFYGAGLEIKRDRSAQGHAADRPPQSAAWWVPALIYAAFNFNGAGARIGAFRWRPTSPLRSVRWLFWARASRER